VDRPVAVKPYSRSCRAQTLKTSAPVHAGGFFATNRPMPDFDPRLAGPRGMVRPGSCRPPHSTARRHPLASDDECPEIESEGGRFTPRWLFVTPSCFGRTNLAADFRWAFRFRADYVNANSPVGLAPLRRLRCRCLCPDRSRPARAPVAVMECRSSGSGSGPFRARRAESTRPFASAGGRRMAFGGLSMGAGSRRAIPPVEPPIHHPYYHWRGALPGSHVAVEHGPRRLNHSGRVPSRKKAASRGDGGAKYRSGAP